MGYLVLVIAIIFPPLGIPLGILGLCLDSKYQKLYILSTALGFASLTYSYQIRAETDIARYWEIVEGYEKTSFKRVFYEGFYGVNTKDSLWLINLLFWASARIHDPRIIPAISTFSVYCITLTITCRLAQDCNAGQKERAGYILFSMMALNYFAIANNVRNIWAFMLIAYAVFRDVYEKKRNLGTLLLYILPVFIHTSAILFVLLRIFLKPTKRIQLAGLIAVVMLYPVLDFLYPYAQNMTGITTVIGRMIVKAHSYFFDTSTEWGLEIQASGSETLIKLLYMSLAFVYCFLSLCRRKSKQTILIKATEVRILGLEDFNQFVFYIDLMAIACIPMLRPEYWRFIASVIALGSGVYFYSFLSRISGRTMELIWLIVLAIGSLCMVMWIRSFIVYSHPLLTIIHAFGASPFMILVRALVHI